MTSTITAKQLRVFGLLVGGVFSLVALWPIMTRHEAPRFWMLSLAGLLIVPAVLFPTALKPFYAVWMSIGNALGWINSRIILGLIFYLVFTPAGLVMRVLRKDPLTLKSEPGADTYRVVRQPRPASHMNRQF
jgi:hypothetical protein